MRSLTRRPRLLLAALGLLLVAVAGVHFSGAYLVTQAHGSDSVTTASVTLTSDQAGHSILDTGDLRPGLLPHVGTVTLSNTGDLPLKVNMSVDLSQAGTTGAALAQTLTLTVESCDASVTHCSMIALRQPLSGFDPNSGGTPLAVATIAPHAQQTYRLGLHWPVTEDNPTFYGQSIPVDLIWKGVTG